ncbi:MAG TPA: carboxypeptidase-like regulatory domain-containing protein [Candidatus Angelobacter sp.]
MQTRSLPRQISNPALIVLENIYVAAPCPVAWDGMIGDARVRHCSECRLNVYNISEMTRTEAEELIRAHEGRLCVRFFRRADGTILTTNCPRGLQALIRRVSRVAAAVLAATMSVGSAFSQAGSKDTQQTQENHGNSGIDLTVVDPTGAVIPGAEVHLCRCKDHNKIAVHTDATGVAHVLGLSRGKYSVEIKATGFKPSRQNIKVQAQKTERLRVKLQIAPTEITVDVQGGSVAVQGTVTELVTSATQNPFPFPATGLAGRPSPLR